ncbi:MAG: rhodanese-like domain-containing protein [Candidatus Saccharimonadales bacterium]
MSKRTIIAIIIGMAIIIGLVLWASANPSRTTGSSSPSPTPVTLAAGTHLYDVRTTEEYAAGHAQFADNWPLADIEAGKLPSIEKDATIAVYCRSGNRSAQAKSLLEKAGFTNVKDIGGLDKLKDYGLQIVK